MSGSSSPTDCFDKLVAWVRAHAPTPPPPPSSWSDALLAGVFSLPAQVIFPARTADGELALSFTNFSVQKFGPAPIPANGKFKRTETISNVNGNGWVTFTGHFEAGRVVVIEDYDYEYFWTNGMFNGFTNSTTCTGSGRAEF